MYHVTIRDHMMIAHSFASPAFGPAQRLHGATYVVDVTFRRETLDSNNIVIDIDIAHRVVKQVLEPLKYQNLDELDQFAGRLTTTEFLARYVFDEVAAAMPDFHGRIAVTLGESHVAWAGYEGTVPAVQPA